jgi:DNA-binding GntR family transcriptional regulator
VSVEPLNSLDRTTLRERALEALRSAITSGRYRPGDHLGEVDLATHLGVSRGTVREALRLWVPETPHTLCGLLILAE